MCNRLFQKKVKYVFTKCAIEIDVIFVKQASEKWNVMSICETGLKCVKIYFKRVKYVISEVCNWNIYDFCEIS